MNALKRAILQGRFAWQKYLYCKTWNGIMLQTQPLFCSYGQIGYKVFVFDRGIHVATFTHDWEKQSTEFSNN